MGALLPLALLACPIGMGLMMWFMMRGSGRGAESHVRGGSLPDLKAEQARLADKIETLEQGRTAQAVPPEQAGEERARPTSAS